MKEFYLEVKHIDKQTDIARALQARDRGFGTGFQMQNGVIE